MTLTALATAADVSPRTVRYYISNGLLPPPSTGGGGAAYGPEHLQALHSIRALKAQHLPLAEIRKRLAAGDTEEREARGSASSALDYLDRALGRPGGGLTGAGAPPAPPASSVHFLGTPSASASGSAAARSTWERHALTPDVELHVRRPLSRDANRKVERLLSEAQALFKEQP